MIESINQEVDKFLSTLPDITNEQLISIKNKYSCSVTDDLKKRSFNN